MFTWPKLESQTANDFHVILFGIIDFVNTQGKRNSFSDNFTK